VTTLAPNDFVQLHVSIGGSCNGKRDTATVMRESQGAAVESDNPERALAEIARVMRPGGTFVFAEHVAARRGTMTRRLQQFATPLTRRFDHGCHQARDTAETLRTSPLTVLDLDVFEASVGLGVTVPFIVGRAGLAEPP
jgi:SAM-dependent methyltransferase